MTVGFEFGLFSRGHVSCVIIEGGAKTSWPLVEARGISSEGVLILNNCVNYVY